MLQPSEFSESEEEIKEAPANHRERRGDNENMMCEICEKYFNLSNKKPVSILCCHNTLCQPCYASSFPTQSTFTCPFGCSTLFTNSSQMTVITPPYCQYLIKQMKRAGESAEVRCDTHPGRGVEYYDQRDRRYKCSECIIPEGVTKVSKNDIE